MGNEARVVEMKMFKNIFEKSERTRLLATRRRRGHLKTEPTDVDWIPLVHDMFQ
jgi:hypothetical protein